MRYGTRQQKDRWLQPLMIGVGRSAFLMSEPGVASSDARNIETSIRRSGDGYVINGRKWWSSGAGHPRCLFYIVMGKTDENEKPYRQQSMLIVPADHPNVKIRRMLPVFGYDHAQHGGHAEIILDNVQVSTDHMLLGEGRGFEIAQGRLGPEEFITRCALSELRKRHWNMCVRRLLGRVTFGTRLSEQSVWEQRIADARIDIEMARLLCLKAAYMMDTAGNKSARAEIAMIKVGAPRNRAASHRRCHPGAWRRRRVRRFRARRSLRQHTHPAHRRRARRGARPADSPCRIGQICKRLTSTATPTFAARSSSSRAAHADWDARWRWDSRNAALRLWCNC